ncbi:helix-turn-helix domain-containing protein [Halalkalibacter alkaliphilus]|uniref:Helix-turn-helix domain-containing protein n=1 Tax=Halalkalibacter alkaliphilus TaxID=2917993 RepID=A0A9X2CUS5_9BACI|nr:helix-turn-helix domain-containing protein [Halalkalibacter alkaliphilus]MCL7748740.1 helix-turn-helix domain-containing protein [Halalkalibacter alkaliphilus]
MFKQLTLDELLDLEDDWLNRDGLGEGDERQAWIEEGIDLYKKFLRTNRNESRYSIMLADLYLEWGRDEKIRHGNERRAYDILRKAALHSPKKPDPYYHLSFILANQDRKWEAALFYGKEALEKGIAGSKKIKLLCNLALGYARLDFNQQSEEYMKETKHLDQAGEHEWFIELYEDKIRENMREPILLKEAESKRRPVSKRDSEKLKDDAMAGNCVVVDLAGDVKYFYGFQDTVRLERREAEVLGFLMDHNAQVCSKAKIENGVWLDQEVAASTIKKYITNIRKKLSKAMNREDIKEQVLITTDDGYMWKADIASFVLRR